MEKSISKYSIPALLVIIALMVAAISGCNGRSGTIVDGINDNYQISGVLIEDWNRMATRAQLSFTRNDTLVDSGLVIIGNESLTYDTSTDVHKLTVEPSGTYPAGTYDLILADLPDFLDTVLIDMADTFSLTISDPPNRLNPGGDVVKLDWTESPGADAYVFAAVSRHLAYTEAGYSSWAGTSEGTVPIEAFRWSDGIAVDTGWYYLFAYAYVGSPDSAESSALLPVPLPSNIVPNIDQEPISGRFGTIVVAGRDSVHVTIQ